LNQIPRGPAPFASFDSIASIDVTTPEERTTPIYQGMEYFIYIYIYIYIYILRQSLEKTKYFCVILFCFVTLLFKAIYIIIGWTLECIFKISRCRWVINWVKGNAFFWFVFPI
jgi:hypothetical protein